MTGEPWETLGHSVYWSNTTLTYSFISAPPLGSDYYVAGDLDTEFKAQFADPFNLGISAITPTQQTAVAEILSAHTSSDYQVLFSDVIARSYSYDSAGTGDLAIAAGELKDGNNVDGEIIYGFAFNPGSGERAGDVWINNHTNIFGGAEKLGKGERGYYTLLHEFGHALGLEHARIVENEVESSVDLESIDSDYDSQKYTIMSYNPYGWTDSGDTPSDNALYNTDGTPLFAYGLQLFDIAMLQSVYGGGRSATHAENDTAYKLGQGLGRDGNKDKAFIYTIWDGGGTGDTLDASDFVGYRAKIDLNEGAFSSIGSTGKEVATGIYGQGFGVTSGESLGPNRNIENVAIAYGTRIENAIGGDQDDDITGNEWDNTIWGRDGNDIILGEDGDDILLGEDASDTLYGGDGNDILVGGAGQFDLLYGGAGTDMYSWEWGDSGVKNIYDDWLENDFVNFGPGVTVGMLVIDVLFGDDLRVKVNNGVADPTEIWIMNASMTASAFLNNFSSGLITTGAAYTPTTTNNINNNLATVNGTTANDSMTGGAAVQTFNGGAGDDIIYLNSGETGNGDGDRDKITGPGYMQGGAQGDWLDGGITMDGGTGDDYISGGSVTTSILGGTGNDTILDYVSGSGIAIDAGNDDDWIQISGSGTNAQGGSGNDVFSISGNGAIVDGGLNDDVIHLKDVSTSSSVTITTGQGDDIIYSKAGDWDITVGFAAGAVASSRSLVNENDYKITFTGGSSLLLKNYVGNEADFTFTSQSASADYTGNNSDEKVYGISFNDIITGAGGDDEIHAGVGDDEVYGGDGNDVLYGDAGDDIIEGDDGDDEIYSEDGDDLIKGGAGTDELFLGSGIDSGDIILQRDGNNLLVQVNDGRTVTLVDQYVQSGGNYIHAVETFDSVDLLTAMLGINNIPQAKNDAVSGNEDAVITGNVLSNNGSGADSDPDSDTLSVTPVSSFATAHGIVSILANGNFTYTPTEANYNGTDSFDYEVTDGNGGVDTATVTLTINAVNDAPVVTNNGATFNQDATLTLTTAMLTASDVDNTASQIVFTLSTAPAHGALKLNGTSLSVSQSFTKQDVIDGHVTFVPTASYNGSDSFGFVAGDGTASLSAASFAMTIAPLNQTINGTSGNDTLNGGAGNDTISGLVGNDTINGYAGTDTIYAGEDNDTVYAGDGNDIIYGYGNYATQSALTSAGFGLDYNDYDFLHGGDGNDKIYAQYNGADLFGDAGDDELYGSSVDDEYMVSAGHDIVDDEHGMNYVSPTLGVPGHGGTADIIFIETASGFDKDNVVFTKANNHKDLYLWFDATHTIQIKNHFFDENAVVEYLYQQSDNSNINIKTRSYDIVGASGGSDNDTLNGFDSLTFGDDVIKGFAGTDTLNGKGGIDWIYGGTGNDILTGGAGNDLLYGEADNDTYVFGIGDGQDTVTDTGGTDKISLGSGIAHTNLVLADTGTYDVEMTFTNSASDKITMGNFRNGSSSKIETISFSGTDYNFIYGTNSSETLTGTSSADLVYGRAGTNSINTGNGNDIIIGGDGQDDVNYVIDTYSGDKTVHGFGGNDRMITGSGNDIIYGGDGDDSINALAGNDTIYGGNGDDVGISGGAGNDTIYGEDGADYLIGWIGNDVLSGGNGADELWAGHPGGYSALSSAFGAHTYINNSKTLSGGAGNDLLYGYIGVDILMGGEGADTLTGDAEADQFKFMNADVGTGTDNIEDFNKTSGDTINIADLMDAYDPMQHAITDFISVSVASGHTTIKVDRDGTGSTYSAQDVAVVKNITWSSISDMVTSGDLVIDS